MLIYRTSLYCIGFRKKTKFKYPAPIELAYRMYDFMEDYTDSPFYSSKQGKKYLTLSQMHNPLSTLLAGELDETDVVKERKVKLLKSSTLF